MFYEVCVLCFVWPEKSPLCKLITGDTFLKTTFFFWFFWILCISVVCTSMSPVPVGAKEGVGSHGVEVTGRCELPWEPNSSLCYWPFLQPWGESWDALSWGSPCHCWGVLCVQEQHNLTTLLSLHFLLVLSLKSVETDDYTESSGAFRDAGGPLHTKGGLRTSLGHLSHHSPSVSPDSSGP